jgi:hypothetical protein
MLLAMVALNALCLVVAVQLCARAAQEPGWTRSASCFAAVLDSVQGADGDRGGPERERPPRGRDEGDAW